MAVAVAAPASVAARPQIAAWSGRRRWQVPLASARRWQRRSLTAVAAAATAVLLAAVGVLSPLSRLRTAPIAFALQKGEKVIKFRPAESFYEGVKEKVEPEPEPDDLVERDRLILEEALRSSAEDGEWERAEQMMEELKQRGFKPHRECWDWLMQAYKAGHRWQEVKDLIPKMEAEGIRVGPEAYNTIIEACEEQDVPEEALGAMQLMREKGFMPNVVTYLKVMEILLEGDMNDEAMRLYEEAKNMGQIQVWIDRGRMMDLRDLPIETSIMVTRAETGLMANMATGKNGVPKGGFYVLTGPSSKASNYKQRAVIRVLKEEFGLKVRVEPAKNGRLRVRGGELKRVGHEMNGGEDTSARGRGRGRRR